MKACHCHHLVIWLVALATIFAGCATTGTSETPGAAGTSGSAGVRQTAGAGDATGMGPRPSPKEFVALRNLPDIHFDFDRYEIRPDAAKVLEATADWLRTNRDVLILIEGHTDERGTNEYNLALGDRRARAALNYLVSRGVQKNRITTITYGEERPFCTSRNEECWTENRRAHFGIKSR
ncbi:MAG TPA: peptidoglycan-associated lipoprotein Pal [Methylomirabilota bacterium]|jgi:peptidoglycan-associated lipoprotein|nr:peptidoglycan-associated lipoprotein Pal [Methylomirabilota bacterium]